MGHETYPAHPDNNPSRRRLLFSSQAPYDYYHDRYQAYYLAGIRQFLEQSGGHGGASGDSWRVRLLRGLRTIKHSHRLRPVLGVMPSIAGMLDRTARLVGNRGGAPSGHFHPLVGQYILGQGSKSVRFCIDAQDSGEVASPELMDWSDCYFKTNFWSDARYPPKTAPLANGNPLLLGRIDELRALRTKPTPYDVAFIVRVWGGRDEVEGLEHNLRLIEALNRLDCKKYLMAYLVAGDVRQAARRLDSQDIPWTTEPVRIRDLWRISAASRLVMIRLGMHQCLPWRMMDSLAMGSCVVLDQEPKTIWHRRLRRGEHYLSLGIDLKYADRGDESINYDAIPYDAIPVQLREYLDDSPRVDRVRSSARELFDEHLEPAKVGRYIVETALGCARA